MSEIETTEKQKLSPAEFALLGGGQVAYVRSLSGAEASRMLPNVGPLPEDARLFGVYAADGTCMAITDSHESALASAWQNDLHPLSVH